MQDMLRPALFAAGSPWAPVPSAVRIGCSYAVSSGFGKALMGTMSGANSNPKVP